MNQAVEQLGRMYRALSSLKQEIEPASRAHFAIMAEGPLDEIRNLEEAINTYTGKVNVEATESDVWIRVVGPSIQWPDAPTSVLTALLDALRKGVQAVAEYVSTGSLTTRLSRESNQRIDSAIDLLETEQIETHVGDLREIDLDNCSFILRNTGDVTEIRCTFEDDILESAKSALDRRVKITGVRRVVEGRRAPTSLRVTRLEILDEDPLNDQSQGD